MVHFLWLCGYSHDQLRANFHPSQFHARLNLRILHRQLQAAGLTAALEMNRQQTRAMPTTLRVYGVAAIYGCRDWQGDLDDWPEPARLQHAFYDWVADGLCYEVEPVFIFDEPVLLHSCTTWHHQRARESTLQLRASMMKFQPHNGGQQLLQQRGRMRAGSSMAEPARAAVTAQAALDIHAGTTNICGIQLLDMVAQLIAAGKVQHFCWRRSWGDLSVAAVRDLKPSSLLAQPQVVTPIRVDEKLSDWATYESLLNVLRKAAPLLKTQYGNDSPIVTTAAQHVACFEQAG
jgi:hypothetical protein